MFENSIADSPSAFIDQRGEAVGYTLSRGRESIGVALGLASCSMGHLYAPWIFASVSHGCTLFVPVSAARAHGLLARGHPGVCHGVQRSNRGATSTIIAPDIVLAIGARAGIGSPASPQQAATPGLPPDTPHAPADAVSEASRPYEPGPAVLAEDSVDGAALRASVAKRLRGDRSPVTVLRGGTALELGERLCEAVVPKVPAEEPVLIKPNIGGFPWFKNPAHHGGDNGVAGRITDPAFVRGIIRCLKARGHRAITVADGWSASHKDWLRLADVSGYQAMAAEEGVRLVAMNDDGVFDMDGEQPGKPLAVTGMEKTSMPTLLMPKIVAEHLDHGLYIAAPKMKTHRFSVVSLAIKGLQGVVMLSDAAPAHRQKWRSHRELNPYMAAQKKGLPEDRAAYVKALEIFAERMVDVLAVHAPHVMLAEGAPAMGGDGFHVLVPLIEGVAVGGTNAIAVDRVGAELLGLWQNQALARELGGHTTSPLIEVAAARFGVDLQAVKVVGDGAALLSEKRPVHFVATAPFRLETSAGLADARDAPAGEQHEMGEQHAATDKKPVAYAYHLPAGAAISVDGRADEPAWKSAREVTWTTDYAGRETGIATRARLAWADDALYALFELDGAGLFTDTSKPVELEHETLYQEDCVEIFLVPDPNNLKHYYEVELGPTVTFSTWSSMLRPRRSAISAGRAVRELQPRAMQRRAVSPSRWP
jgi:uncharacterized protein (DUF362 family)